MQALLDRYQHVVRFSSYGHKHHESFYLTRQGEDAIGFNFIHGSVTTFEKGNPTFYVIDWDEQYMVPIDIHVYYLDIEANEEDANWRKLYSMREEYGLSDLSPASVKSLLNRMYEYDSEGRLFVERYLKNTRAHFNALPDHFKEAQRAQSKPANLKFKCDMQFGSYYQA